MRGLEKRLTVLEGNQPEKLTYDLSGFSVAELECMEAIVIKLNAGTPMQSLGESDIRLIASIPLVEP
jgi:hypothetical protein